MKLTFSSRSGETSGSANASGSSTASVDTKHVTERSDAAIVSTADAAAASTEAAVFEWSHRAEAILNDPSAPKSKILGILAEGVTVTSALADESRVGLSVEAQKDRNTIIEGANALSGVLLQRANQP